MANDTALGFGYAQSQRPTFALLSCIGLLLLIYVGLDAFSPPPIVAQFGGPTIVTGGDSSRQIAYLGIAGLVLLAALQQRGLAALRAVPLSMALLLGWCLASALWAHDPGTVVRRAVLQIIVVVSIFLSVEAVGARRAFLIWTILLGIVTVVNFLSIPVIPAARHPAGELDAALVGNWRGLYGHKNITGAICATTAILFLFSRTGKRNWIGLTVAAGATVFLVMAHSKSSLGFLPIAALAGYVYHLGWRDGLARTITVMAAILGLGVLITLAVLDAEAISRVLSDPREFTGRSAIWAAELAYIGDHPFLGAGYGAFADTKGASPLVGYVSDNWVKEVSHGHNGYLQVLVTVGGIGFALTFIAAILLPLRRFWKLTPQKDLFRPMLFALFIFQLLLNLMESNLLEGGSGWASMMLVVAALNDEARNEAARQPRLR
jgi:O-antigen ligase